MCSGVDEVVSGIDREVTGLRMLLHIVTNIFKYMERVGNKETKALIFSHTGRRQD